MQDCGVNFAFILIKWHFLKPSNKGNLTFLVKLPFAVYLQTPAPHLIWFQVPVLFHSLPVSDQSETWIPVHFHIVVPVLGLDPVPVLGLVPVPVLGRVPVPAQQGLLLHQALQRRQVSALCWP